ncbi:hypothetical protein ScPMuIL_007791, partial [Solemya velum]
MSWFQFVEHSVFIVVVVILLNILLNKGKVELFRLIVVALKQLPGIEGLVGWALHKEVTHFVRQVNNESEENSSNREASRVLIPKKGIPAKDLRDEMKRMKSAEPNPDDGKMFAYVYTLDDDHFGIQKEAFDMFTEPVGYSAEHDLLVKEFHHAFLHENALNPIIFPSLRKMETEIISMAAGMLNGDQETVGFLTSGGTESNLMAVKAFRDRARKLFPHIKHPEIVAPTTIHPTIDKAAHYFGLHVVHTPVTSDYKADVRAMERAISPNTILLSASAPHFCHGIVDPIEEISDLAIQKGLPFHVDCCFGGFMLPWVEKLGYPVPKFDFRLPGVTSMSADIHKYGYGVKGSSLIMYRNEEYRKYQIYTYAEWPGGLYGSPSMAGTRPGAISPTKQYKTFCFQEENIAASWASMRALGEEGYMFRAKLLMEATTQLKEGIQNIMGLHIIGEPHMTCFAVGSCDPEIDILALADAMETKDFKEVRVTRAYHMHSCLLLHVYPFLRLQCHAIHIDKVTMK